MAICCSGSPSSAAQVLSNSKKTLSRPVVFLGQSFLSCLLTRSVVMRGKDGVDMRRRRDLEGESGCGEGGGGKGWSNLLKKSFSSVALLLLWSLC